MTFLSAEWRKLLMANYVVDPAILKPYLPHKTELDLWQGRCYVSLVGFMFLNTRLLGFKVPYHSNFEEINLRFYVRFNDRGEWKRGVVFMKEIVPRHALSLVANTIYGEHYETRPMKHAWKEETGSLEVSYHWKKGRWHHFGAKAEKQAQAIPEGSEEEFITEHYWGYTRHRAGKSSEYKVEHPRWEVYPVRDYSLDIDYALLYGKDFSDLDKAAPSSVFLAEGSEINVMNRRRL